MKLSDQLYEKAIDLWREAAHKPFVLAMAKGTLDEARFRRYMIQDYLYLLDYIGILKGTLECTDDPALKSFLTGVIAETERETTSVHVPNMKKIGVTDEDISEAERFPVIIEYVGYMGRQLANEGLLAGLTALLQCSWVYAYIGETILERYPEETEKSPYKSWFDSYAGPGYKEANSRWVKVLDEEAKEISGEEQERLCRIFATCAGYENRFWDELYQ
ncbi:MAG: hypothetical protein K6E30_02965 [Lachnospiraceae bacterium]|nr:hypothetical protein [Lachnospiraceae bacterium]